MERIIRPLLICLTIIGCNRAMSMDMLPIVPGGSDTVSAVVVYGDETLLESGAALSDEALDHMLDSLCTLDAPPAELLRDLLLFKRIRTMDQDGMMTFIDSLFELETVPYALVNEINLYASQLPSQYEVDHSNTIAWARSCAQPGAEIYGAWNTISANAYGPDLSKNDSLLMVQLTDPDEACGFHMPIEGVVTSRFGWRDGRPHNGIDIDLEVWDTVRSVFPGVVRFAGTCGGFGRLVVVRHFNGLETYYAHLHRLKVTSGDEVDAGELIGLGGSSGHSTGSHLHFEVRFKGIPIDPAHMIEFSESVLHADTLVLKKTRYSFAAYPKGTRFHTVEPGEHLSVIAELYGTSIESLCELNNLSRRSRLRIGQKLMVNAQQDPGDIVQALPSH